MEELDELFEQMLAFADINSHYGHWLHFHNCLPVNIPAQIAPTMPSAFMANRPSEPSKLLLSAKCRDRFSVDKVLLRPRTIISATARVRLIPTPFAQGIVALTPCLLSQIRGILVFAISNLSFKRLGVFIRSCVKKLSQSSAVEPQMPRAFLLLFQRL
jgi:hypothetical protein